MRKAFILVALIAFAPALCVAAIHCVRVPADCPPHLTYNGDGTTWNCAISAGGSGAFLDFPANLIRGDTYLVGGSATSYPNHLFNDADSGTKYIYIYKAVDCSTHLTATYCSGGSNPLYTGSDGPQNITGWSSTLGTTTADWVEPAGHDPGNTSTTVLQFCPGDYYVMDGITGSALPASGPITTPTGQGFVVGSYSTGSRIKFCNNSQAQTGFIFNHIDSGGTGLAPYWPAAVTGCVWNGTTDTITTDSDIGGDGTHDKVDGWTTASAQIYFGGGTNPGIAATSITPTTVVITPASDKCSGLAYIALDFSPPSSFFNGDSTGSLTNLTIENSYLHDGNVLIWLQNSYSANFLHNYIARNRSTPAQHGSPIEFTNSSASVSSGPATIAYNFLSDNGGTGWITLLNKAGSTFNGLAVYSNILSCSSAALGFPSARGRCNSAMVIDNGSVYATNSVFYNNTVANVNAKAGYYVYSNGSTGGIAQNNLFWNASSYVALQSGAGRGIAYHDYNTLLDSAEQYGTRPCTTHETCITSGALDPFVNDATFDFTPANEFNVLSNGDPWSQGHTLGAPYDKDFYGTTFGSTVGYARGAIEFPLGGGPTSNATLTPTSMSFTSQAVGVLSSAKVATLTNIGSATLNIANIGVSGYFSVSATTCGLTLAPLAACTISVKFTPAIKGESDSVLTVTDDSGGIPGSQQTAVLVGIGVASVMAGGTFKGGGSLQ